ncbi:hypothetical protein GALMADRAFT_120673 [Galerina marginata CBS 339.88]|uniref:DUF6533 domain-containing protein n=1 Tax=Galerina marginata (strain CBS 339.88) TaxID=685588 RepID=A0A067T2H5_GALM3|nr:hypothetical protein GALMADRAFT_120673 [Galerina marginata CBS 339.88]
MSSPETVRLIRFSIEYSSIALLFYDYALTWTREVTYFWGQKFKVSTALYIACRYAMVSNILYALASNDKFSTTSCNSVYKICSALSAIGRAAIIFVWCARTYAVFSRNKYILLLFGPLGILIICLDAFHVKWVVCNGSPGNPIAEELLAIFMVIYEFLSGFLTTMRSWQALRVIGTWTTQKSRLIHVVVREGLLYFGCVTALTTAKLILLYTAPDGSFIQRLLTGFTLPISGLMTARFLLHLREWDHKDTHDEQTQAHQLSAPIQFADMGQHYPHILAPDEFGEDPVVRERRERMTEIITI